MAAEKQFENKVKKFLKVNKCWFLKYWGGAAYTKSGIPDILVCCKGRFLGVEVKAPNGTPTDLQIYNLRQINRAGLPFYSIQKIMTCLRDWLKILIIEGYTKY